MRYLYVVRHGLRANLDPPPTGIAGDVSISKEGFEQAEELAQYFASAVPRPQRIYSSPFYRCLQTIAPTSKLLGVPIRVERGVSEYYTTTRPTHPVPRLGSENAKDFPTIDLEYNSKYVIKSGGETREMLHDRVVKTIELLLRECEDVDTVLIATHAATKIAISHALVGEDVRTGTASIDYYTYDSATGQWTLNFGGFTDHLSGGEQMHWSFEMQYEAGSIADEVARAGASSAAATAAVGAVRGNGETARILLPLDFQGQLAQPGVAAGDIEIIDLESETPVVRVGEKVFTGEWSKMVGTELFTTQQGDLLGQANQRVLMTPVNTEQTAATEPLAELLK